MSLHNHNTGEEKINLAALHVSLAAIDNKRTIKEDRLHRLRKAQRRSRIKVQTHPNKCNNLRVQHPRKTGDWGASEGLMGERKFSNSDGLGIPGPSPPSHPNTIQLSLPALFGKVCLLSSLFVSFGAVMSRVSEGAGRKYLAVLHACQQSAISSSHTKVQF